MAFELNRMSIDDQAFDSFEQDFRQRQNVLNTRINELNIGLTREDRRPDVIKTCENDVFDLGNMLKKWELELRSLPFHLKNKVQPQLKKLREQLEASKQDFARAKVSKASRTANSQSEDTRSRLLQADQALIQTEESAYNSKRMLAESEAIGQEVTINLQKQRAQLQNARDDLAETDDTVNKAASTLRSMGRRVLTDKLVQGVIVVLELGICGLIVYFRYYRD